jgi:hypothetical protein
MREMTFAPDLIAIRPIHPFLRREPDVCAYQDLTVGNTIDLVFLKAWIDSKLEKRDQEVYLARLETLRFRRLCRSSNAELAADRTFILHEQDVPRKGRSVTRSRRGSGSQPAGSARP